MNGAKTIAELRSEGEQICVILSLVANMGNLIRQFVSSFLDYATLSFPFAVQIQRPTPGQLWRTSPGNINMCCWAMLRMESEIHGSASGFLFLHFWREC